MNAVSFVQLQTDMLNFVSNKELFIQDLYGGAEQEHRINVRLISELAWHNLFLRHLLIKPTKADLKIFSSDFTIPEIIPIAILLAGVIEHSKSAAGAKKDKIDDLPSFPAE